MKKANAIQGCISGSLSVKVGKYVLPLGKALVRCHQKYCGQFWSPMFKKNAFKLERMWERATRIRKMKSLSHKCRLGEFALFSLAKQKLREYKINLYKSTREGKSYLS